MTPEPNSSLVIYDQNFNGLGETIEAFNKSYEDERITRSKGKEIFTFQVMSTSAIYKYLKVENIVEFGGRWFRIKYLEDDDSIKGLTTFTCYALWYELSEGMPTSLSVSASNLQAVASQILQPFGKWTKLVIPTDLQSKSVRGVTLKENSGLYQLRYLAKQYELELTFGYEVVIGKELRYVKTVVFLQQYAQRKLDFPLIVEENLRHITKTEDSRNLITAYKLTGKSENDEEEFTFASINNGNPYLVDTSWFNRLGVKPRIIPKSKQDDRFTVKQNMLDAARQFLDIYAKPLITYEAGAILYSVIPDLHDSQLIIDDTYDILEWRRVSSRKLNYDDLTSSTIIFDDPRQNLMDLLNDDGDGALSYQENETARPIIRFADDVLGTNMNDTSGKYIGVITTKKPVDQLSPDDFTWVLIEGPRGLQGPPGQQGPPGRDGVDGIAGRGGVGIASTDITYYLSTSGTITPTSGWTSSVPELIKGRYLWTRTIWTYTDGQRETGYQVTYIGQDGNTGRDGLPGKAGVGITSTVITYARSTSGTSAPTSGWISSVPTVPPGEFLWTKTIWNYSDNTNETGYSVAKMGDTGPKGTDGKDGNKVYTSTYELSANQTGAYLSDLTPTADATNLPPIGSIVVAPSGKMYPIIALNPISNPPTYTAGALAGNIKGADGRTPYVHFAYADNADGIGLTFTDTGQRYMGHYSDYTQSDSTDKTKYRWADRWAKIDIDTRNLWIQSKANGGFITESLPDNHITGQKTCYKLTNNTSLYFNIEPDFSARLYQKVTFSAWIKYDKVVQGTNAWKVFNCFKHNLIRKNSSTGTTSSTDYLTLGGFTGTSDWKYISYTYDYSANKSYDQLKTPIFFNLEGVSSGTAWVTGVMIQFGNIATGHEQAPEDIQANIDTKADQALTQQQLNMLIEKAQLMQTELEAKVAMETLSDLERAYNAYVEANDKAVAKSQADLIEAGRRVDAMVETLGGLSKTKKFIDTYIKEAEEGIIIGTNDNVSQIRVTYDRIAMYSAGEEVMYISQGVIHIDNGVFTKTLQIGRFRTEQHQTNPDINICRYVG